MTALVTLDVTAEQRVSGSCLRDPDTLSSDAEVTACGFHEPVWQGEAVRSESMTHWGQHGFCSRLIYSSLTSLHLLLEKSQKVTQEDDLWGTKGPLPDGLFTSTPCPGKLWDTSGDPGASLLPIGVQNPPPHSWLNLPSLGPHSTLLSRPPQGLAWLFGGGGAGGDG